MASTGTRNDPLLGLRFQVAIDDLPPAGFSECSGLQAELEVQEYREGAQYLRPSIPHARSSSGSHPAARHCRPGDLGLVRRDPGGELHAPQRIDLGAR